MGVKEWEVEGERALGPRARAKVKALASQPEASGASPSRAAPSSALALSCTNSTCFHSSPINTCHHPSHSHAFDFHAVPPRALFVTPADDTNGALDECNMTKRHRRIVLKQMLHPPHFSLHSHRQPYTSKRPRHRNRSEPTNAEILSNNSKVSTRTSSRAHGRAATHHKHLGQHVRIPPHIITPRSSSACMSMFPLRHHRTFLLSQLDLLQRIFIHIPIPSIPQCCR